MSGGCPRPPGAPKGPKMAPDGALGPMGALGPHGALGPMWALGPRCAAVCAKRSLRLYANDSDLWCCPQFGVGRA